MDPKDLLVTVANLIANDQYDTATQRLVAYATYRDNGGEQPIVSVAGRGIEGDRIYAALEKTIKHRGGFYMLLTTLNAEHGRD